MTLGQHAAHALHDVTQQWSRNNLSEDQVKRSQERFNELLNEPMPQVPYEKGREEVARLVEQVTRSGGKVGEDAILSLMSALLIGSWTAFESLASDLWVAACNCRPMSLGVKALLAQKGRQQVGEPLHPTTTEQRGQQGKKKRDAHDSIKLDVLRRHKFNLQDKLGTIVSRSRKFTFSNIDGIGYAYRMVFGDYLKGFFETYADMPALEAIRHVLVHRAGEIDQSFISNVENIPVFSHYKLNDRLQMEGEMVRKYVTAGIDCADHLLWKVDEWLTKNQE